MNTLASINALIDSSHSGLAAYIAQVNSVAILSQEEEFNLALRFREHNDLEAAKKLILANLRYVVKVARGYLGYGLSLADLIQEGNIGLMKAVKRFDHKLKVRLVTFAMHWIKAELHDFVVRNWRIVKVATTKAQRKLFFKLRSLRKSITWMKEAEIVALAADLGVKPEEVREMEMRVYNADTAYDNSDADDDHTMAPVDYLVDSTYSIEHLEQATDDMQHTDKLQLALKQLDSRSQNVVTQRWLADTKQTLQELAEQYNVSMERIRQIEAAALRKLKQLLSMAS